MGFLASYDSAAGYGLPFAYCDENNNKSVRDRKLSGYGSILPCIPGILKQADIPQLMALVAPRPLTMIGPKWASGAALPARDYAAAFAATADVYALCGCRPACGFWPSTKFTTETRSTRRRIVSKNDKRLWRFSVVATLVCSKPVPFFNGLLVAGVVAK